MSSAAAVIQLHQREAFERNVTRAVLAGAGAGALAFVVARLGFTVPLTFLSLVATVLACVRGPKWDRVSLAALALVLPAVPWLFGMSTLWTIGLSGAVAGALMVRARAKERGDEGSVGAEREGPLHYLATALATAGLAVAGTEVGQVVASQLGALQAPALLRYLASGAVVSLFAGIGGLAAHLALKSDPVEARGEEVLGQVSGEFQELTQRALTLYRQAGASLASLPRDPAREELARTVSRLTKEAFDLSSEWAGVESSLHEATERELAKQVAELTKSAMAAKDPVAKRQLELAGASLTEELGRLGELKLKRERVVAKLKSQLALLERARVALIGMRSSHATIRAAEMSAVARKLNALATAQADEAALAHEVATGTELKAMQRQAADDESAKVLAQVKAPTPSAPSVGPAVVAPEAPAPVDGAAGTAQADAHGSGERVPVAADAPSTTP